MFSMEPALEGMDASLEPNALSAFSEYRIAVIIPCYNEAVAIPKVIADFRKYLPTADIYVYDNNSTDGTAQVARDAGAIVRHEYRQGKGYVVRRMFTDVMADIYVMVDGDDTYDASVAPQMVHRMVTEGLDLVNCVRDEQGSDIYRRGHRLGNSVLTGTVSWLFGRGTSDMLSGYRVFSKRFVKSFPMMSRQFEIETELTIHSLELNMPIGEVHGRFQDRPAGSESKLSTFKDGFRILRTIIRILKEERPMLFYGGIAAALAFLALVLGLPVVGEFTRTGLVPRLPTALLSASIMLLAALSLTCGLILQTVTRGRQEVKRLAYNGYPGPINPPGDKH